VSINVIKTANFGSGKGSLSTVGYRMYNSSGVLSGSRITGSVGEVLAGAGIYSGSVHIADNFIGHILWDTGEATPTYATEDVDNILHTLSMVSSSVDFSRHIGSGRWKMDKSTSQMIFYKEDNLTEIARYDLTDESGNPSTTSVFERNKV